MKTLKESILNRSSHGAKGFEAQRRESIEKWLKEYNIKNYTINDDFTINVERNVDLSNKDIEEFPEYILFNIVEGYFDCSHNHLTSLRGCPRETEGDFNCSFNKLTSLEGAPKKVKYYFNCSNNKLTSLEGAPKKVGWAFNCSNNKLTSLEGTPRKVDWTFNCSNNKLTSLEGAPKRVEGEFICSRNSIQFTEEDVRKVCNVEDKIRVK